MAFLTSRVRQREKEGHPAGPVVDLPGAPPIRCRVCGEALPPGQPHVTEDNVWTGERTYAHLGCWERVGTVMFGGDL